MTFSESDEKPAVCRFRRWQHAQPKEVITLKKPLLAGKKLGIPEIAYIQDLPRPELPPSARALCVRRTKPRDASGKENAK